MLFLFFKEKGWREERGGGGGEMGGGEDLTRHKDIPFSNSACVGTGWLPKSIVCHRKEIGRKEERREMKPERMKGNGELQSRKRRRIAKRRR